MSNTNHVQTDWKRRGLTFGFPLLLMPAAASTQQWPSVQPVASPGRGLDYIADLKPSFPEHRSYSAATAITHANHRAVLEGLRHNVGVNGLRLPIVPGYREAADYSVLHRAVLSTARGLGLLIYASPLSVGMEAYEGWSDEHYATWLASYANAFRPDVLSPFNEAGIDNERMAGIVGLLRQRLTAKVRLAGPDRQHVGKTLQSLRHGPPVTGLFDILTSHNADRDASATVENWSALVHATGGTRPVWSSENPADWAQGRLDSLPGLDQAVAGGIAGLVIWMAKPELVDDEGRATPKALEIAAHLGR